MHSYTCNRIRDGTDQTAVITCEELKAAFETALSANVSITDEAVNYSNFAGLQIQVNGTVIKSVSYTYGTPATEDPEPETPANVEYNFDDDVWSDWQSGAVAASDNKYWPADYTDGDDANGLSFIKGTGSLYFQTNGASCMIGTQDGTGYPMVITPSYRLQLGGSGTFMTKACIGVPVEGACSIYVVAASGSSQASVTSDYNLDSKPRLLVASYEGEESSEVKLTTDTYTWTESSTSATGSGILVPASTNQDTENCLFEIKYDVAAATTVYLYSSNSGINIFYIYVSYDGTEPDFSSLVEDEQVEESTEATWTVIATNDDFVTDETKWVGTDNNQLTIAWNDLANYTYIAIVGTTYTSTDNSDYANWGDWGAVEATTPDANGYWFPCGDNFAYDATLSTQETIILNIEELHEAVDEIAGITTEVFYLAFWSNTTAVTVYASADYVPETDTEDDDNQESSDDAVTVVVYEYESGDMLQAVTIFDSADTNPFAAMTAAELATVEFHVVTLTAYDSDAEDKDNNIGYSNFVFVGTDAVLNNYWMQAGNNWDVIVAPEDGSSDNYTSFTITYEDAIATMIDACELSENYSFADLTSLKAQLWNASYFVYIDYTYTKGATSGTVEGDNEDEGTSTAISNVNVEVTEVARYNLMGQKISGAEKGINIIVYSDGSAKKVLVK